MFSRLLGGHHYTVTAFAEAQMLCVPLLQLLVIRGLEEVTTETKNINFVQYVM